MNPKDYAIFAVLEDGGVMQLSPFQTFEKAYQIFQNPNYYPKDKKVLLKQVNAEQEKKRLACI